MSTIFKNVTGNMIMINETGTEIPPDAEFDIEDHPELERSHQFKRLISMNFIVKIPSKRSEEDPVKVLHSGPVDGQDTIDIIRQIASEMGAVLKEAIIHDGMDIDRLARQVGDHIMQNVGMVADKQGRDVVKTEDDRFDVELARAKMMDSTLRFRASDDRPSVSVNEEVDDGDDLGDAANRLKRTLQGDDQNGKRTEA